MLTFALIFGLSTAEPPSSAATQPSDAAPEKVWLANISANPMTCNLRVAAKVKFAEVIRSPGAWLGKCIALDGYWKGRTLYINRPADGGTYGNGLNDHLGLYGREALLNAAPRHPRAYTAVGMLGDCKRLWDAAPMVLGYCHYHATGPYLALAEMTRR